MTKRMLYVLATLLTFSLVASACGDDDEGGSGDGGDGDSANAVPECLTSQDLYAIFGPESTEVQTWADAQTLATELESTTELPAEGDLQIYGPGTESGTYDAFVELALADIAEERQIPEEEIAVGVEYTSSPEDNAIVSGVAGGEGTLGWLGYAFYANNTDELRAVQVDAGDGCVEPTIETIADGSYALSRPLYIYVNSAKLEEKPALASFVDLWLNDAYSSVEDAGYVALPDEDLEATRTTFEDTGVEVPDGGDLSGELSVIGSSTVEPVANLVAETFLADNGGVQLEVDGPGTGDGFELHFCTGESDIALASRAIDEEEVALCQGAEVEYIELLIGLDGITVITNS
jgi:ABC-type phosphate transport system substrate-binding protein